MSKYDIELRDNLDKYFIPNITDIILDYYICIDDFCTECDKHKGLIINIETKKNIVNTSMYKKYNAYIHIIYINDDICLECKDIDIPATISEKIKEKLYTNFLICNSCFLLLCIGGICAYIYT